MKDILTKGTAEGVRIYALCTTNLVQEAAIRHHTSHWLVPLWAGR